MRSPIVTKTTMRMSLNSFGRITNHSRIAVIAVMMILDMWTTYKKELKE